MIGFCHVCGYGVDCGDSVGDQVGEVAVRGGGECWEQSFWVGL